MLLTQQFTEMSSLKVYLFQGLELTISVIGEVKRWQNANASKNAERWNVAKIKQIQNGRSVVSKQFYSLSLKEFSKLTYLTWTWEIWKNIHEINLLRGSTDGGQPTHWQCSLNSFKPFHCNLATKVCRLTCESSNNAFIKSKCVLPSLAI